ncbi:hypothetical protein M885DRAFT_556803 [Pelagophyceae sp. CCMP2097]|nr:hypothetical protein M885DRAFT_556803 [Pelagophyceae sp. CCMP2097]
MLNDADLESYLLDSQAAAAAPAAMPLCRVVGEARGSERPRPLSRVCASFRAFKTQRRFDDEAALSVDGLGEPAASLERGTYVVAAAAPELPGDDDLLDEWLNIPARVAKPPAEWAAAVDAAVCATARGEVRVYWDAAAWVVEVEVHEILTERDLVDGAAPDAVGHHGCLAGSARLKLVAAGGESDSRVAREGCVVRGTWRVVSGLAHVRAAWLGAAEGPGGAGDGVAFAASLGNGELAEGFEAALQHMRIGTEATLSLFGECLLPDSASVSEAAEFVPSGWWANEVSFDAKVAKPSKPDLSSLPCVVLAVRVDSMDGAGEKALDAMTMSMDAKEHRAATLKDRGAALWAQRRFRRAEAAWRNGVRLFSMIKPEDSAMDPGDVHLGENNRGRAAAIPLLLNEALALRRRGDLAKAELDLNECLENDAGHVKALFRRGQLRIALRRDLLKWDGARSDLGRALDCGGADLRVPVEKELRRLKAKERVQDAKDGKYFKDAFGDDREAIYDDKRVDAKKMSRARAAMRTSTAKAAAGGAAPRQNVAKSQPSADWTKSYSDKERPSIVSDDARIDSLSAELDEISDDEDEARRRAKEDYYNTQIGLGHMRIQAPAPPPPPPVAGRGANV